MSLMNHPDFLCRVLVADAAACAGMGTGMAAASGLIATLTGLPPALVLWAGLALLPIAAFIAVIATRPAVPAWGVWFLVIGNAGWVLGSAALPFALDGLNALGIAFVAAQAVAVLALTELEIIGLRKLSRRGGAAAA